MTTPAPTSLALEIKAEMTRQQVSAADLAEKCGMSVHQVNRRLSGAVELTVSASVSFADALSIPLHKLMERAEQIESSAA